MCNAKNVAWLNPRVRQTLSWTRYHSIGVDGIPATSIHSTHVQGKASYALRGVVENGMCESLLRAACSAPTSKLLRTCRISFHPTLRGISIVAYLRSLCGS
jgi:hypothetical protein